MGEGSGGREFVALGEEEESILSKKGNKGGGVVSSPIALSFVLSVEEEDERRKKIWKEKFIKLLSLFLLQEGITTLLKGKSNHNTHKTQRKQNLKSPLQFPHFLKKVWELSWVFYFPQANPFCCYCL